MLEDKSGFTISKSKESVPIFVPSSEKLIGTQYASPSKKAKPTEEDKLLEIAIMRSLQDQKQDIHQDDEFDDLQEAIRRSLQEQ
jgi:hypothetical protein